MRTSSCLAAFLLLAPCALSAAPATPFDKGGVGIDQKQFLADIAGLNPGSQQAPVARTHFYCVHCKGGPDISCPSPAGGEVGKQVCGTFGRLQCASHEGQVAFKACLP